MVLMGDRVPMFRLHPYRGLLMAAVLVLLTGSLASAYFFIEGSYSLEWRRGLLILIVTLIFALLLVIAAFSRYGFRHLWHHRPGYKRG